MYDAKIGRWLSVDPRNQYWSPYVGMGNNPIKTIDPTGGKGDDWWENKITKQREWFDEGVNPGDDWAWKGNILATINLNEVSVSAKPIYGINYSYSQLFRMGQQNSKQYTAFREGSNLAAEIIYSGYGLMAGGGIGRSLVNLLGNHFLKSL